MDRDRRLAEMMGLCGWYCTKCDKPLRPAEVTYEENCLYCGLHLSDPDFTTPEWRAQLMDFCVGQEWWNEFKDWSWDKAPDDDHDWVAYLWRTLPDPIMSFHGEGG